MHVTCQMTHNQRTMKTLGMQFAQGGTCMYALAKVAFRVSG